MHEGTAVALCRECKIIVPNVNKIAVDNYVVLFLAIWSLPMEKNVIQASCNKALKCRLYFMEKTGCV